MKPEKCDFANFEYIFNWIIDIMKKFMMKVPYDEKHIKSIRYAATNIFISYEKELIGKTNKPACEQDTLDKIIRCREETIDSLDCLDNGKDYKGSSLELIRDALRSFH